MDSSKTSSKTPSSKSKTPSSKSKTPSKTPSPKTPSRKTPSRKSRKTPSRKTPSPKNTFGDAIFSKAKKARRFLYDFMKKIYYGRRDP